MPDDAGDETDTWGTVPAVDSSPTEDRTLPIAVRDRLASGRTRLRWSRYGEVGQSASGR